MDRIVTNGVVSLVQIKQSLTLITNTFFSLSDVSNPVGA